MPTAPGGKFSGLSKYHNLLCHRTIKREPGGFLLQYTTIYLYPHAPLKGNRGLGRLLGDAQLLVCLALENIRAIEAACGFRHGLAQDTTQCFAPTQHRTVTRREIDGCQDAILSHTALLLLLLRTCAAFSRSARECASTKPRQFASCSSLSSTTLC